MGWNPIKDVQNVVEDAGKVVEQGAQNIGKEAEKGAQNIGKEAEKGAQNIGKEAEKGAQNIGKEAEIGVQNIGKEVEKGIQNAGAEGELAVQNTAKEAEIALRNVEAEAARAHDNVAEAATATYNFFDNQLAALGTTFENAQKRALEGKWVDAVWHMAIDPVQSTERNAAEAIMESALLNNFAAVAAGAYGGPAGSAAYAAWVTYKATGSLDASLKAGAIAWASSQGYKSIGEMPGATLDEKAKKVLASAAMSGAAIAASGGSDEEVLSAFQRGAVAATAREVYRGVVERDPDGKIATKEGIAKLQVKEVDPEKLKLLSVDKDISHVGVAIGEINNGYIGITETSGLMEDLSKIPLMNDMAIFHDKWMEIANLEGPGVQFTILPAIALTGAASPAAAVAPTTDKVIDKEKEKDATP